MGFRLRHLPRWLPACVGMTACLGAAGPANAVPPLAPNAMPGIYRTGLAMPAPVSLAAFAATLGYGYTEPQPGDDATHHRQIARLGVAVWPVRWLGASLRLDERYDLHSSARAGNDDGLLIDPSLSIRASFPVADHFHVAPELSVWLPATEDAGTSFAAPVIDARALATIVYDTATAGVTLGYRVDRSAKAGVNANAMQTGDRLALGLSAFDAVTAAVGGSYTLGRTTLKGEFSGDLLIGKDAPPLPQSPLRIAAGAGQLLGPSFSLDVLVELGLSARPSSAANAPLIPVEPRFAGLLGLRYHPPVEAKASMPPPPLPAAPVAEKAVPPSPAPLDIHLSDDEGQPVVDAKVQLEMQGRIYPLTHTTNGTYHLDAAPLGEGKVLVESAGATAIERAVNLGTSPQTINLKTVAKIPAPQVRGLVRSMAGRPLRATIRIEPPGTETKTDERGRFELDLDPGVHDVVIEAPGFHPQRRRITLQARGVVVINADLVKGGP